MGPHLYWSKSFLRAISLQYDHFSGQKCLSYVHVDKLKDKYINIFMLN